MAKKMGVSTSKSVGDDTNTGDSTEKRSRDKGKGKEKENVSERGAEKKSKKRKHEVVVHQSDGQPGGRASIWDVPDEEDQLTQAVAEQPPAKKKRSGERRSTHGAEDHQDEHIEASQPVTKKRRSDRNSGDLPPADANRTAAERPTPNQHPRTSDKPQDLKTSKPSAVFKPRKARDWTVSMAVPGSIIRNVAKPEMKTLLAGRIARAAAVWCVDEIIVFDDDPSTVPNYLDPKYFSPSKTKAEMLENINGMDMMYQNPDQFLYYMLSYAECPPHLIVDRENPEMTLYPQSEELKWVGLLPPFDMPHHLKREEWCRYREGISIPPPFNRSTTANRKDKKGKSKAVEQEWTYVKCGLPYPVRVKVPIEPKTRVTLDFKNTSPPPSWPYLSREECENLDVEPVEPSAPREEGGYYWGYILRKVPSISAIYEESPFEDGYDFCIGTSERGAPLTSVLPDAIAPRNRAASEEDKLPDRFKHLLVMFGGVAGLEPAVASDPEMKKKGLAKKNAHEAFDFWVNLVEGQGSRTIRTEEAVEIGLAGLKGYVDFQYEAEEAAIED